MVYVHSMEATVYQPMYCIAMQLSLQIWVFKVAHRGRSLNKVSYGMFSGKISWKVSIENRPKRGRSSKTELRYKWGVCNAILLFWGLYLECFCLLVIVNSTLSSMVDSTFSYLHEEGGGWPWNSGDALPTKENPWTLKIFFRSVKISSYGWNISGRTEHGNDVIFLFFLATVLCNLEVWKVKKWNVFLKYISAAV